MMSASWIVLLLAFSLFIGASAAGKIKVFLLAGQSNMVGQGSMDHLDLLFANATASPEFRETLSNGVGGYKERDNVYVTFNGKHGKLTVSRTLAFAATNRFGPEVMFGWTVGDAIINETVLLIKTAWGGLSLAVDFRPPSAGLGNHAGVNPALYGVWYRTMIADIRNALANVASFVPSFDPVQGYEVAGFVWFQGWNDLLVTNYVNEYASNLACFIRDVRLDLNLPSLPFGTSFASTEVAFG
jgi:hypothetical protein